MSKRPAFQFYPGDWRIDPGLRLCSMGARGLWIEMMCLMHDGDPYGHLTVQGRPIDLPSLSRLVGEPVATVKRWIGELRTNNVFSETEDGVVFSRRMVRDEDLRKVRAAGGKEGAQHGHKGGSHGAKGGRPKKQYTPLNGGQKTPLETPLNDDERGEQKPPPSSSSSSSVSSVFPTDVENTAADAPVDPEKQFWADAKAFLGQHTKSDPGALVNKWLREHGKEMTVAALNAAQLERAVDPLAYIPGYFRRQGSVQAQPVIPI